MKPPVQKSLAAAILVTLSALSFSAFASEITPAPVPTVHPAADLGEEVMKPMGHLFGTVQTELSDATKNADAIANIKKIQDLVAVGLVTVPSTDHYNAEVALVGADAALAKYKGLLTALNVTLSELSATIQKAGTRACGTDCQPALTQLGSLEELGHSSFKDDN